MHIQVCIHEDGVLRNQQHAFTNRFTVVTELLQNARRAGADRIDISHDETAQWLRVEDNGHGIESFQSLLRFYASGWDEATKEREHPFGVGFSKCLFAARRCIVLSRGKRIDFDTALALAKYPVEVVPDPGDSANDEGTVVELHGVALTGLAARIESICQGFPVEVFYNGRPMGRRHAEALLETLPSPIGTIHLAGTTTGLHASCSLVFLQGICVLEPPYVLDGRVNVVHLDARQFIARVPDRDKLIDEDIQIRRIDEALQHAWRAVLLEARDRMTAKEFVRLYYPAMRTWRQLDLLNDLDELPSAVCGVINGYPVQRADGSRPHLGTPIDMPTRGQVERGEVTLVALDPVNEDNTARWMLSRARRYLVVDVAGLHAGHWAAGQIRWLEDEAVSVEAVGECHRTRFDGRWITPALMLCQAVRIRVGRDTVEVTDRGVYHDDCLYIPTGDHTGDAVRQVSPYTDEDDKFLACELDVDRARLEETVRRLRAQDALGLLESMLTELGLGRYPVLHGRQFLLTVGTGGAPGHSLVPCGGRVHQGEGHAAA